MEVISLLLISLLTVFVIAFLVFPFYQKGFSKTTSVDLRKSTLLAERDRILDALAELEMDYQMGKVEDSFYKPLRQSLVSRGADVLRNLDEYQVHIDVDVKIKDDPLEKMIVARWKDRENKKDKGGYCHNCGEPIQKGNRFCSNCGTDLG